MISQKVVFITGAASGIGLETGIAFAKERCKVIITDLDEEKVIQVAASLKDKGLEAVGMKCDVSNEKEIQTALNRATEIYGGIDILINNAGLQHIAPLDEFPTEKFELLLKVMLVAPFLTIKNVFPQMKDKRWGRIINMASINGLVGFAGKSAYNSAKHGVIGLTKVAALEGAEYGITVNAVCPGYVDTPLVRNQLSDLAKNRNVSIDKVVEEVIYPLVPQKRLLAAQEITDYVIFLAGDKAKGVTGQAVVIDGGYTAQ
jgi:3-hydroxybutyrate dehydrogenase